MKIKKVRLENFRGFEGVHEFELHSDHINVIIGANGAGKTSVLDALCNVLNGNYNDLTLQGESPWFDKKPDISFSQKKSEVKLLINLNNNITECGIKISKNNNDINEDYYPKKISFSDEIIYKKYPSDRHMILEDSPNNFPKWYKEQINIQNNEKIKREDFKYFIPSINVVNNAVNTFLKELSYGKFEGITLDKSRYLDFLVLYILKTGKEKIEFDQLSSGEKAVFSILLEIAQDAYEINRNLKNPLLAPGIVLIDEIELHLHPKWQTSILQALNKTFPNIQFIVTTHSPLVINHLKNENLILLDDFKITEGINVQNIYGRDVNSIITDFMGASAKPKEVESLINDIEVLLDEEKPDISLAKEKLNELKNITSPNHSDALKLETLITIEEED